MKLKYWLGIAVSGLMMLGWYIATDRPVTFVLLGNGHCYEQNSNSFCRAYMVKCFSKLHTDKHLEEILMHAYHVTNDSLDRLCPSAIVYFRDTEWTKKNADMFMLDSMEELNQWDRDINLKFTDMDNSYLCRVTLVCNDNGVLLPVLDKKYIYGEGTGYLE
jgi:hypothetical protein